jgi:GWxTD domain-containing protein
MVRQCWIYILLVFVPVYGSAIDASVAKTLFYKPDSVQKQGYRPSLEIYWQVNPRSLHFATNQAKQIVARILTDISLTYSDGSVKDDQFILQTSPRSTPEELADLSVLEIRRYDLKGGPVKISLRMTDMNDTGNKYVFYDSVDAKAELGHPFYSDIQMLDTSVVSATQSPFLKNGRQQIPLCADFLDDNKRMLHYYAELYALGQVPGNSFPLVQRVRLAKKPNESFFDEPSAIDTIRKAGGSHVSGSFPIGKLKSGNYYIVTTLEDKTGYVLASKSHFFQRLNMHPEVTAVQKKIAGDIFKDTAMENVTVLNLDKTFLAKYSFSQLRAILKMLLPVSDPMQTSTINNFLKKPDEMYMRYFVYNYFQAINEKNPAAAWKEYTEKVLEVNKKFSVGGAAGYETDRGFIYLRYGKPTDVVTVSNETGALPYEIWQYNVLTQFSNKKELANALFLFYKSGQMMSDYNLLHSTVTGEIINMNWRRFLYTNTNSSNSSGVNTNSRAEQFIGNR